MDILTDTILWVVERSAQLTLSVGRWASKTFIGALDWTSAKAVGGLRLMADLTEWVIANPWKALQNAAIVVAVIVLVLMIEIYFYDLIRRRQDTYRARLAEAERRGGAP